MFIISEISPQFGSDLDVAEQMILQSKLGGASACKVQLYPADMFATKGGESRDYLELSRDSFFRLREYGERVGIEVFATAFTDERLEWCIDSGQKYYKVAARQHRESPDLVKRIMSRSEDTFVSIPNDYEVDQVNLASNHIALWCVPKYPTLLQDVSIPIFEQNGFRGISDHSIGIAGCLYASSYGATVAEKHFTIDSAWQRSTEMAHLGAMNVDELRQLKSLSYQIELIRSSRTT